MEKDQEQIEEDLQNKEAKEYYEDEMTEYERQEEEESEREAFQARLEAWLEMPDPEEVENRDLVEALYSFSEYNLFPDYVGSISAEQAILCWKIVERVRLSGFPRGLRM